MIHGPVQLIDRPGTKRVADLGPVEGNPDGREIPYLPLSGPLDLPVVGDVLQVPKPGDESPAGRVEEV